MRRTGAKERARGPALRRAARNAVSAVVAAGGLAACALSPLVDDRTQVSDESLAARVSGLEGQATAPSLADIPPAPTDLRGADDWDAAVADLSSSRDALLSDPDLQPDADAGRLSAEEFAAQARARAAAAAAAVINSSQ